LEGDGPLGVSLVFKSDVARVGDFGFEGPIKAVLDGLGPLFGTYSNGPRDYRVRELRIERGGQPGQHGVSITIWRLPRPSSELLTGSV